MHCTHKIQGLEVPHGTSPFQFETSMHAMTMPISTRGYFGPPTPKLHFNLVLTASDLYLETFFIVRLSLFQLYIIIISFLTTVVSYKTRSTDVRFASLETLLPQDNQHAFPYQYLITSNVEHHGSSILERLQCTETKSVTQSVRR